HLGPSAPSHLSSPAALSGSPDRWAHGPRALLELPATSPSYSWWNITSESSTTLPPLWFTEGTWDAADGYLMFYGGDNWVGTNLADTWAYSGGSWNRLSVQGQSPGPLDGPALAYDPPAREVVMYGGLESYSPFNYTNLTWTFSAGAWSSAHLNPTPPPRLAGSMTYDADLGGVVLFGGYNNSDPSGATLLNDLWLFKQGAWSRLPDASPPPVRTWATLAFDPGLHKLLLFSGINVASQCLGDTWTYSSGTWTKVNTTVGTSPICATSAAYDPDLGAILLTGGFNTSQATNTASWEFTGTAWAPLTLSGTSDRHIYAPTAWDPVEHDFVVAAGWTTYSTTNILSAPLAIQNVTGPARAEVGELASFTAAITGGVPSRQVHWAWGDGTTSDGNPGVHPYASTGTYVINVTATDATRDTAVGATSVEIIAGPAASIAGVPAREDVGVAIDFTGTSTGGSGSATFAWTFGDGAGSSVAAPIHAYHTPATYLITLAVRDAAGGLGSTTRTIEIVADPTVQFGGALVAEVGIPVAVNATISGGIAPYTYAWSFDDGATASSAVVNHTFRSSGPHTAVLTVNDSSKVSGSGQLSIDVLPALAVHLQGPTNCFTGVVGQWSATVSGGRSPSTLIWTLPDGSTKSGSSVTYTFPSAGSFHVQVTATDSLGAKEMGTENVSVVTNSSGSSGSLGGLSDTAWIGIGVGVALIAGVAGFLMVRRRRSTASPPPEPEAVE
ncbi:MAG TPA: PKD domain-containing protein, partial [Thermoplasmata archaeon]|nr:PKD domain-containing protein [Thermoplasmata archaeon]